MHLTSSHCLDIFEEYSPKANMEGGYKADLTKPVSVRRVGMCSEATWL
jgi:hypothetical protein